MARRMREMDVPAEAVFAVLADGHRYPDWVVGTREIRDVDPGWPAVGTNLHFTVGRWPLEHRDRTEVLELDTGRRLVLEARGRRAGTARIAIEVQPTRSGCRVVLEEHPLRGPAARWHNPVLDFALGRRLDRMLQLLERAAG